MSTHFPAPKDKAPHPQPAEVRNDLRLGILTYDIRRGTIAPSNGSIGVAQPAKEPKR